MTAARGPGSRAPRHFGCRTEQPLIDPDVNLAEVRPSLLPARWIVPLEESPGPVVNTGD